ncbi:hypothetical protein LINPERHAP1_LOCUS33559 [Linum perenne]
MQHNSSSLTWDPTYEAFVEGCKLREVVRVLGTTYQRTRDHIPTNLLTLLGDPGVAATFSWGSVVLAWLYRQMGRAAFYGGV